MNKKIVLPTVTLVGQNNVGKSTLFNRLTCTHDALVSNFSGVTRDRKYGCIKYKKFKSIIIDTGGFNRFLNTDIQHCINHQTIKAIQESNVVLCIVNGKLRKSLIEDDIIGYLRRLKKKIILVINKIDNVLLEIKDFNVWDYYSYGIKDIIVISAMYGYGIDNLLNRIFICEGMGNVYVKSGVINDTFITDNKLNHIIKLAIIGRPNSGKSTFVNCVLHNNRMITSNIPGTTHDSIEIPLIYNHQKYIFIDTPGIRKKKRISSVSEEKIFIEKTLKLLIRVHIILYMIDVKEGFVDQDLSLLKLVLKGSTSLIIIINKCDTISNLKINKRKIIDLLGKKVSFLFFVKMHFISSLYGTGIKDLFKLIKEVYDSSIKTIGTAVLNRIMKEAIVKYPPQCKRGTFCVPRLKFVHIGRYNPIVIVVHGTKVSKLSDQYKKYLKKFFYRSLSLSGIIFHMKFKDINNPFHSKKLNN